MEILNQIENNAPVTAVLPLSKSDFLICLSDGSLSVYSQQTNEEYLSLNASLPSACNTVTPLPSSDSRYAFGCANGIVYSGKIFLSDKLEISVGKELIAHDENKHGIDMIIFGDFDGDGEIELGVLRQDNQIQIWQLFQNEPILRYQSKAADGFGKLINIFPFNKQKRSKIIVTTFSGWIFYIGTDRELESSASANVLNMQTEINNTRDKIDSIAESLPESGYIFPPKVSLNVELESVPSLSIKMLIVESQIPIELIQICSTVRFELVEDNNAISNVNQAVRSVHADPSSNYPMMITYRCQADTTRLEVKIRPIEGYYGEINVFVFPKLRVNKIVLRHDFTISALSLHQSITARKDLDSGPCCTMKFQGEFSSSMIGGWLKSCLPNLPNDTTNWLYFENLLICSWLKIIWGDKTAIVSTNNVSALSIIRGIVLQKAVDSNIQVKSVLGYFNWMNRAGLVLISTWITVGHNLAWFLMAN